MGILMAGLSPHPPLIIPEIGGMRRGEVRKTIDSLEELAEEIVRVEPDLLITISPHGPVFSDAISIFDQLIIKGDFSDFACPEVKMEVKIEPAFINKLKEAAEEKDIELIMLSSPELYNYNLPSRLDHGVMVPLYFLKQAGLDVPVIPITMGLLGYQELYDFGLVIQNTLDQMDLQAVILASGDLSHRLKPGAPAGFNPRGREFDERLIELIKEQDYQAILEIDSKLIEKAGECGLRPIIIMLGSLRGLPFRSEVKSYEGPFGVGYAVVGFYPS